MIAIETDDLTKRFRQLRGYRDLVLYPWRRPTQLAVDTVSLQIDEGELFGLLGENGAGKTTLIRMLSTTLLPTSGTARVAGHDVVREAATVRRMIGIVSGDERSFYWRLTGRQNLEYFAALYHVPRARVASRIDDVMTALDVSRFADGRFSSYSTGIKQRFAIARGLLADSRILFLDEPTRALDPIAAAELRRYIVDHVVGRLGCTALIATHSLSEAEEICNRVAIVRHGRIVASGSIKELTRRMNLSDVFEMIVGEHPEDLNARIMRVSGVTDATITKDGDRFRVVVLIQPGFEALNDLLQAVLETGARVVSTTTRRPVLDDVYRAAHAVA